LTDFRFVAHCGLKSDIAEGPKSADFVAKVENRTTPKISQMLIFGPLGRRNTQQRRYQGPWSFF